MDRLYTLVETAERYRCSTENIRRPIANGTLSAIKPGKQWLIAEPELIRYEDSLANQPNNQFPNQDTNPNAPCSTANRRGYGTDKGFRLQ